MLKKENGITLVALVVTIVVLLILAGVSISLVLGQNGLITRAQEASNATANATANEATLFNDTVPSTINTLLNGYY
jgi:type II secretory pathway pseudopilin PulG